MVFFVAILVISKRESKPEENWIVLAAENAWQSGSFNLILFIWFDFASSSTLNNPRSSSTAPLATTTMMTPSLPLTMPRPDSSELGPCSTMPLPTCLGKGLLTSKMICRQVYGWQGCQEGCWLQRRRFYCWKPPRNLQSQQIPHKEGCGCGQSGKAVRSEGTRSPLNSSAASSQPLKPTGLFKSHKSIHKEWRYLWKKN